MRNKPLPGIKKLMKESPLKHPAVAVHTNPHEKGKAKVKPTYVSPGWPKLPPK